MVSPSASAEYYSKITIPMSIVSSPYILFLAATLKMTACRPSFSVDWNCKWDRYIRVWLFYDHTRKTASKYCLLQTHRIILTTASASTSGTDSCSWRSFPDLTHYPGWFHTCCVKGPMLYSFWRLFIWIGRHPDLSRLSIQQSALGLILVCPPYDYLTTISNRSSL